jgi:hypothetical protein
MFIVIFIFKYKYRILSLNNLIFLKKIKNILILNLSGRLTYLLGLILYKILRFNSFFFISCDGQPFLKKSSHSINLWFGGTNYKIPEKYSNFNNNKVAASSIFTNRKLLFQIYPCKINYLRIKDQFQFVFISKLKKNLVDKDVKIFWSKNKKIILNKLSLIDNLDFWRIKYKEFNITNNYEKQKKYIQLKCLLRIQLIKIFYKKYYNNLIIIGSDWKKYIPTALPDNYSLKEVTNYYKGNICVDLGAQDGDEIFYPRSIQIIENGGYLFQARQKIFDKKFSSYYKKISFNSSNEMLIKANLISNNPDLANKLCSLFYEFIEKNYSNYKNLKKLFTK